MFLMGYWSNSASPPPPIGGNFVFTQRQGGFAYNFTDGKTWHLGGYGADSGDFYDLLIKMEATNIVGSWSSVTFTFNNVVWTGNAVDFTLRIMQTLGGSSDYTSSDTIITSTTMTNGATSVSITLTGTNLQNYFNGVSGTFLYFEWNPAYFDYYMGFDSISVSIT